MSDDYELPCVVVWCEASNAHFVWLEIAWDESPESWVRSGRRLIARAPHKTCEALRELLEHQRRNEYAN